MTTQTKSAANPFEQVFDNLRKVAESNIEMQQEVFRKWSANWPGFPQPQTAWVEKVRKFQKAWATTVKELLTKHRQTLDQQYDLAVESLEEAFRVAQFSDPEDYSKRCETLCRKSLEVLRESGELQVKEMQATLQKWTELAAKAAS